MEGMEELLRKLMFDREFVRPAYRERLSFANLPASIAGSLGGSATLSPLVAPALAPDIHRLITRNQTYKQLVLVLVDGFGAHALAQHSRDRHLAQFLSSTRQATLTSQFPSTTSAHITTLHSGLPVYETGVYEWFYLEPSLNRLISPLIFTFAHERQAPRGSLAHSGFAPDCHAPWDSYYQQLDRAGIQSFVYQSSSTLTAPNAQHEIRGATALALDCLEHGFAALRSQLRERATSDSHSYHYLYISEFDGLCHEVGPASPRLEGCVSRIFSHLCALQAELPAETLLLVTADHGQTAVNPEATIWLDTLAPKLRELVSRSPSGEPHAPAGSARDLFLHFPTQHQDVALKLIREAVGSRALVLSQKEFLERGLFGATLSTRLLERLGNILVLPYANETVWWSENGRFPMNFRGHHGGLSADEMLVPLIAFSR